MHRILRTAVVGSAAALALAAGACGGGDEDVATRTAPGTVDRPAGGATAGTNAMLRVTDVALGRAMRGDTAVVEEVDDFRPNDTIHAVVRHEGAAQNASVTARWTFQDGQVVDERTEQVTGTADRAAYTHFMISKPGGWPRGSYKLAILVNGQEVQSEEFEVAG